MDLPGGQWLEPGAGEGNIIRAVDRPDVKWTAVELRPECRLHLQRVEPRPEIIISDKFITRGPVSRKPLAGRRFDVAMGNPPYSLAMEFVREALTLADHAVMLLRLNFLGSKVRSAFMRDHPPDLYLLPNRPSFTGADTDSIEYAWFHWKTAKLRRSSGRVAVLGETDATTRATEARARRQVWATPLRIARSPGR